MPSLFQSGVEQGSNTVSAQRGAYAATFDIPTGSGDAFSFGPDDGDEFLDLTDPQTPLAPAGVYVASMTVAWNEEESGASARISLSVGGLPSTQTVDLGVHDPGAAVGGSATAAGTMLLTEDFTGQIIGTLVHDRATDNLTGEVVLSVLRLY